MKAWFSRSNKYAGQALVIELYRQGGVRAVEIGSVMFGRHHADTGQETYADHDLVRLAIPRRVYTKSQIDYVVETILEVYERRHEVLGVKIVQQPRALRHFTAAFAPLAAEAPEAAREPELTTA